MTKVFKITARLLYGVIEWLLLFVILFAFAIRTSPVQTYLAGIATGYLSDELGTTISIEKLDIVFIDKVDLKGVLVLNQNQSDTIVSLRSLLVNVDGISSFRNKIHLNSLSLEHGVVKLEKDAETGDMNLKFIIDYFKSDKPKQEKSTPVLVDKAFLNDIRFHFDNNLVAAAEKGMDYQHLLLSGVELDARKIKIDNGVISADVRKLAAHEKSGFQLDNFTALLKVSNQGLDLQKVNITTPLTNLNSQQFKLNYTSYTQYKSFVDSVAFDADLYESTVSFSDIALFAPQLTGMDQQVEIEGKFTKFIKDLKVEDFVLKTGAKTELRGTLNLPDFRYLKEAFYQERIEYAFVDLKDLQAIKLPESSSARTINLDANVNRLGYFEAHDVRLDGIFSQFVLSSDEIKTAIGSVNMDNGILFTHNPEHSSFLFSRSEASNYDVKVNHFKLGKFLNNSMVGEVDGTFFLTGEAFSFSDIHFNEIEGNVRRFDLSDYSYSDIKVKNTSFIDKILYAEVDINDKNLLLNYSGTIDLNGEPVMDMTIDLQRALLGRLHIIENDSTNLIGKIQLNTVGVNPNTMEGTAEVVELLYVQGDKRIAIPKISLAVTRDEAVDKYELESSLLNASIDGKIDFNNIGYVIQDQVSHLFPGFSQLSPKKHIDHQKLESNDCMVFNVKVFDMAAFLDIFQPNLRISSGTTIKGDYDASKRYFEMDVVSDKVTYGNIIARGISLSQFANSSNIEADYRIASLSLNDSVTLEGVQFTGKGNGNDLASQLIWNPETENASDIQWNTQFETDSRIRFTFEPSYFAINKRKWKVQNAAVITIDSTVIDVTALRVGSDEQFLAADGRVSTSDKDKLNFEVHEVDLQKLGQMLGLDMALEGKLNGWGYITNPYTNLKYMGDLNIQDLTIDREEVGDIYLMSEWDDMKNLVSLRGDLIYRDMPTFQFEGTYDVSKKTDNLDFFLVFDQTNISFVNAFMDPLVIDDVKGYINGKLGVTGSIARPIIDGTVKLDNASAKIVMFGTSFHFNGPMYADSDGFYIDYMPIADAEGNTGALTGSIYHNDYKNWNFDVAINIEEDYYKRDPKQSWVKLPLEKFLVMNTDSRSGDMYYGKAYVTGNVGIFGYLNNLDITVNVKTQKGTAVNLDLFGQSELSEDNFIEFKSKYDTLAIATERKIDYTGVSLNLNFDVTRDAQLKLIFNEQTGDEITALGEGKIGLSLDRIGQMSLDGKYTIAEGSKYNFVLGPIKETFHIKEGGSVVWTGNPYDAILNLKAYHEVRANLGDLSPELLTSGSQLINCYLNLSESLMKPTISFNIEAPKAPEQDKALLNRLTADNDELNRQFFSLLLWKKFQPMKGSSRAGGGAALDMASNQINSLLSQVSQDYELNVNMTNDAPGQSEYAVGVRKGFLDDQLIISGSFGTRNLTTGSETQSSLIGDLEIEYKLNKDGTFRINVFNESNDTRGLQSSNRGQFKQGVGIYYKENFNTVGDFKLLQQFLDIFRKKGSKRFPIRRKRQQTPVPGSNTETQKKEAVEPRNETEQPPVQGVEE